MTIEYITKKIIQWELLDYPEFDHQTPEKRTEILKSINQYADGLHLQDNPLHLEKQIIYQKLAKLKLEYYRQMDLEQGKPDIASGFSQVDFFKDILQTP